MNQVTVMKKTLNKKLPNLILLSLFWSLVLALAMTLIGFMPHDDRLGLTQAAGGIAWGRVTYFFLGWFAFTELVLLIGGLLYIGRARLKQGGKG